jgi:PII-like signaling protein
MDYHLNQSKGTGRSHGIPWPDGICANTRVIHTFKIERLSEDLPVIIELVDAADKIEAFLSFVEQHIHSGLLATMEQVEVRFYSAPKTPQI